MNNTPKTSSNFSTSNLKRTGYLTFLGGLTLYNIIEAKNEIASHEGSTSRKIKVAGDFLQVLIPTSALAFTVYENDNNAQTSFIKSSVVTFAITHVLKHGLNTTRPNGGTRSFPSGHTSSAFQGASFIHKRYGLLPALLPYTGAGYVGFSRIKTKRHFLADVLAGACIGTLVSMHFGLIKKHKKKQKA